MGILATGWRIGQSRWHSAQKGKSGFINVHDSCEVGHTNCPGGNVYKSDEVSESLLQTETDWCERLYEEKAAELILYGRALGLSHGEAEDVLQETFIALLRRPEAPEKPAHYCIRAFRHRVLNHRRGFWRRITRELESRRWFEPSADETLRERAAMRCLAQLPVEQREAIVLKIWHDHTFEEIGQLLGISPNTVAGRYRYGMQKLQKSLKGRNDEQLESLGRSVAVLDPAPPLRQA